MLIPDLRDKPNGVMLWGHPIVYKNRGASKKNTNRNSTLKNTGINIAKSLYAKGDKSQYLVATSSPGTA